MNESLAIQVENVSKTFRVPHERRQSLRGTIMTLFKHRTYSEVVTAKDISFEIKKGEFFGIIGRNGSGKSTLLKMLAKIYVPDEGKIRIHGRLSPFLELGVGFNPELSARENVYLNGTILGLSRKEINQKFGEIIEFAELQEFVDQKLKNFSSGMQVRLAFSVAIHAHSEILLIDEVLAVGDVNFQQKCYETFRRFKKEGKTVVFVSHGMSQVSEFCDRVAVIEKGELRFIGETQTGVELYNKMNAEVSL
jgi:ABC-type polysaccharide/polyol phosphate transport system ATPase subunit